MKHGDAQPGAGTIDLKRAYDAPESEDGIRVLVDRLWPRGVSKVDADLDAWMRELGPSDQLREWFGHQPDRWQGFTEKYRAELTTPLRQTLLAALQGLAGHPTLTLVYGARDTKANEAVVLRDYLLQQQARPAAGWDDPTTLLAIMAVVAAAHHDAVASASGVQRFAAPLLTADQIAAARSTLVAEKCLRSASDGWKLTASARERVHQLAGQRASESTS